MKRLLAFVLLTLPAFAQVTTINGTDTIKNSRAVINTNFSNLQSQKQAVNYAADTGAADAYVVTLSPALGSYADGTLVTFKAANANATTTPTVNVNSLGAKTIIKQQNVALAANDIIAGGIVSVRYDTTAGNFQMVSPPHTGGSGASLDGCSAVAGDFTCTGSGTFGTGSGVTGDIGLPGSTSGTAHFAAQNTAGTGVYQAPSGSGTHILADIDSTQTLSNKTLSGFVRGLVFLLDGGGSALTTSKTVYYTVPFACTISKWYATADTGTITIDVWKIAAGTAIPTVSNTITASAVPAIASGTAANSSTLTSWTTAVAAGDILAANVKVVSGTTNASLTLKCDQ
jgi:hypothetical protein